MNTEQQIARLENEIKALKAGFERSALTMPIYTKTTSISTTSNKLDIKYTDEHGTTYEYDENGAERILVTFTTARGSNTIACLEVDVSNTDASPVVQRIDYPGGAKWIITGQPHMVYPNWYSTDYTITVHSMVDGTLTAEEMTS